MPERYGAGLVVQPGLLDRLIDEEPKRLQDPPQTLAQSTRSFKIAVCRDLEILLNTRFSAPPPPEAMTAVRRSVYCYGLPDLGSFSPDSPQDRQTICTALTRVIELFEPRLAAVNVRPLPSEEKGIKVLRFLISGVLRMDPSPEQISFDTVLELARGEYRVKEG